MSTASPVKIISLCTWQRGFHHGTFNAALIQTVALAYPDHCLRFHADASHLPHLREVLALSLPDVSDRVEFVTVQLGDPQSALGKVTRFMLMLRLVRQMLQAEVRLFVFADLGGPLLMLLKRLMNVFRVTLPVIVIAHGLFEPLGWSADATLDHIPSMRAPSPPNLRLVVLGHHIVQSLMPYGVGTRHDVRLLPHPVLELRTRSTASSNTCRFVFPGVPDKGLLKFAEMAKQVRTSFPETIFSSAGFASFTEEFEVSRSALEPVSDTPLPFARYIEALSHATHGVWFTVHQPDPYRFRASGTIPDLIACGKPGIFLRNAMVDDYFTKHGEIGQACDTWDDLVCCIKRTASGFTGMDYEKQIANVSRLRSALSPASLSSTFIGIALSNKANLNARTG